MDGTLLMRGLLAIAVIATLGGCLRQTEFKCTTDADCSASDGVCEATGYCSFADSACAMGRRYGDFSGSYSKQCVGEQMMMPDGGGDSMLDGPAGGCPATYATLPNAGSHVYKLTANAATWSTQRDRCATDGAYLAIPDNAAELTAITTAAAAQRTWVGISDTMTEGTYETVKNMAATFLPWDSGAGEPNDSMGGQDCVSALMANPLIETDKCSDTLPAVCECEP